jgi:hypothetical protein
MKDLVEWLYHKDELNKGYYWHRMVDNCQGFANRIVDKIAKNVKENSYL